MERIQANDVRQLLRGVWPGIKFIWLQDRMFMRPSISEVEGLVISSGIHKLRFSGEVMDCDDYALLLNAYVKHERIKISDSLPADENFHYAFGEAFGDSVRGNENHSVNICLAEDAVYLIEPQTYEIWQPTNLDSILIVKM